MHWNKFSLSGFEAMLAMGCRFETLFSSPDFPSSEATKPLPTPTDPAVEAARERSRLATKKRKGFKQTILTTPLGVPGTPPQDPAVDLGTAGTG